MKKIRVGLARFGLVFELHMYAYRRVYGVDVEVKAVAARGDHVVDFARKHRSLAPIAALPSLSPTASSMSSISARRQTCMPR